MTSQNLEDDLAPYLTYSVAAHLAALGAAIFLFQRIAARSTPVYMIDFVGPTAAVLDSRSAQTNASQTGAMPQPQSEVDEFSLTHRKKGEALPRPSLLRGWRETTPAPQKEQAQASTETPAPALSGQAGIATDLPNFPYPWYLAQLRQSLWDQWSGRMPKEKGECTAAFSILPNGRFTDLRTEESSGDPGFDLTALSAVQDAAPYPPLPRGFKDPFLKIHVTFKTL